MLKIDKQNLNVGYNDEKHSYFDVNSGANYSSVSYVKSFYEPKFDDVFWSTYKVLTQVKEFKGEFFKLLNHFKESCSHSESIKKAVKILSSYISYREDLSLLFNKAKAEILNEWKIKSETSIAFGNDYHKSQEEFFFANQEYQFNQETYKVILDNKMQNSGNYCYPEFLCFNNTFRIAGTADLVLQRGKKIIIFDYKTVNDLSFENKYERLHFPVDFLDNCNYNKYWLQLNMYAFLLTEGTDFIIDSLVILHIHKNGLIVPYAFKYDRDTILKVFVHFRKIRRF